MKSDPSSKTRPLKKRKGSRSIAEIPADVMRALNLGEVESKSLVEGLAVDFKILMRAVFPEIAEQKALELDGLTSLGITKRMEAAGRLLYEAFGSGAFERAVSHASDTVRGWAAYASAADDSLSISDRISRIVPSADDPHFGVREWAQLALRPHIARHLSESIALLLPFASHVSENLRRFAVEATRPRGVWTCHIPALKDDPALAEPLLARVAADPSRYVQNSVGNWLNDAAKSRPDWVEQFLRVQKKKKDDAAFRYIADRAMRSVGG